MRVFIPFTISFALAIFFTSLTSCNSQQGQSAASIDSFEDSVAYAVGMDIAKFYKKQGVDLNPQLIYQGMVGMQAGDTKLSVKEALAVVGKYQQNQLQLSMASSKIEGERFLSENEKKPGVKALPSGLQYKVSQEGKGESPKITDRVKVAYKGMFVNGTVFTDTELEGGPVETGVQDLLPGWTEALLLMKEGSKWTIYLPHELAYGQTGFINPDGQMAIPPYTALIYEIELVEIL